MSTDRYDVRRYAVALRAVMHKFVGCVDCCTDLSVRTKNICDSVSSLDSDASMRAKYGCFRRAAEVTRSAGS